MKQQNPIKPSKTRPKPAKAHKKPMKPNETRYN